MHPSVTACTRQTQYLQKLDCGVGEVPIYEISKGVRTRGWSCGCNDRPREIEHLAAPELVAVPARSSSSNCFKPTSSTTSSPPFLPPSAPLPFSCPLFPGIILQPHGLASTSSTCSRRARPRSHTQTSRDRPIHNPPFEKYQIVFSDFGYLDVLRHPRCTTPAWKGLRVLYLILHRVTHNLGTKEEEQFSS
uniref:Uncharacterized protein n=1 Tax=Vespula pensylvanica TaxID=30213 RepID=A0A834NYZ7_VESPE|nr:hypothetical protein H0235_009571 [Vespula pensylvanica]